MAVDRAVLSVAGVMVAGPAPPGTSQGLGRPSAAVLLVAPPPAWARSQGLAGAGRPAKLGKKSRVRFVLATAQEGRGGGAAVG